MLPTACFARWIWSLAKVMLHRARTLLGAEAWRTPKKISFQLRNWGKASFVTSSSQSGFWHDVMAFQFWLWTDRRNYPACAARRSRLIVCLRACVLASLFPGTAWGAGGLSSSRSIFAVTKWAWLSSQVMTSLVENLPCPTFYFGARETMTWSCFQLQQAVFGALSSTCNIGWWHLDER